MNEPRLHLHPIYELVERSLALGSSRKGRLPFIKEETPSLSTQQRARLMLLVDIFVTERRLHRMDRQVRLAQMRHRLAELDGEDPGGFFPRSAFNNYRGVELLLVEAQHPEFELELMRFVREAAHMVPDGQEFLAFLDTEILRAELATRGVVHPCPERFVGATPVFRAPGTWLYRDAADKLLLLRHADAEIFFVDGSDDDVLASVPDEHFAAAVAVVRG